MRRASSKTLCLFRRAASPEGILKVRFRIVINILPGVAVAPAAGLEEDEREQDEVTGLHDGAWSKIEPGRYGEGWMPERRKTSGAEWIIR